MGLCNSFGFEFAKAYADDMLIISNGTFEDHLNKVKIVLKNLKATGFKIIAEESFFARDNLEYHGCKINRQGAIPVPFFLTTKKIGMK